MTTSTPVTQTPAAPLAAGSRRLIEEWLPIAALSEESVRERRSMTALPPVYYLHVWWARRPLVASRAAILASLLPHDADRDKFMHMLGIHGDPVASRLRIDEAKRSGERFEGQAYDYKRAFTYNPSVSELKWLIRQVAGSGGAPVVLDPTAGGGSIPFEATRLGASAVANDLNPVAWLILKATIEFPAKLGKSLLDRYKELSKDFVRRRDEKLRVYFPPEPSEACEATNWIWARTIICPYTGGVIPLSPNWRLNNKGTGVRLAPVTTGDAEYDPAEAKRLGAAGAGAGGGGATSGGGGPYMHFQIVHKTELQSDGTVKGGQARCPFPGEHHHRVIDGDYIKAEARAGRMGDQLFAVVYTEHKKVGETKTGKAKYKKVRGFRAPRREDDVSEQVAAALAEKMPGWEARGIVPDEPFPENTNDDRPLQYGMPLWRDLFSPRQLLGHCTGVEVFHELVEACSGGGGAGNVSELDTAALTYIAIAIDKMVNWNSILSSWNVPAERMRSVFDRHDFAFKWSYAEMAPTVTGIGYDWAISTTGDCVRELIELAGHDGKPLWANPHPGPLPGGEGVAPPVTVTCGSGDQLGHLADGSVDAVVMDPPYYDNVMYAELADFFYVWLKRTAGLLFPEPFSAHLTDKDREAVANPAKFKAFKQVKGSGGVKRRASRDYQERMASIFAEARRVLKPPTGTSGGGIMTLMFTHKASGAWDALAKGLVDAGFIISASWPIQTEAEGSLHIKDKNAAKSTIFLVCRPLAERDADAEPTWWEDVEPKVERVVRERVETFQAVGIGGVDLYLACFGPALEVFSAHWPMKRGRPVQKPEPAKGAQLKLAEDEEFDPYAVRPEDALMAARRAVKDWRFDHLTKLPRKAHLDAVTEWFIMAWDAFKAAQFPADEALKLARVVGVSFEEKLRGKVLEVKGGDVVLWDSTIRAKKGAMGGARADRVLDALHQAAFAVREKNLEAAKRIIEGAELVNRPEWLTGLACALEVLPVPGLVSKMAGPVGGAAKDAEALEQLRKLLHGQTVPISAPWLLFETKPIPDA